MATFAKQAFNAASYSAIRPTYPRALYDFVYTYHARGPAPAQWNLAVDLGCGTGQATSQLTGFKQVIGVDPSEAMLKTATALRPPSSSTTYIQAPAEDLPFLNDASVDLVVSAQAAHWFDYAALWPTLARVLRPHGTVAFWGYSQFRVAGQPTLTPLIHRFAQGADPHATLGAHWERPGRTILDNHLRDVPRAPPAHFADHTDVFWTGAHYPDLPAPRPTLLRKRVSWDGLQAYLRTFSALYTFHEQHPADAARRTGLPHRPAAGDPGDIVERFWWALKEEVARTNGGEEGEGVEIEWPMAMMLCRRV